MKLIELFESADVANLSVKELAEVVKRDCAPFLKHNTDVLMFRGMMNKSDKPFKATVRQDRNQ